MKRTAFLGRSILVIWIGLAVIGLAAEIESLYTIGVDNNQTAVLWFNTGLFNGIVLVTLMATIAVLRYQTGSDRRWYFDLTAGCIFCLGWFGHLIGAMLIQSGEIDVVGTQIIIGYGISLLYLAPLVQIVGPKFLSVKGD